jgi:nitrogen regulatory protein PII
MTPMKRLDIVVDALELSNVAAVLDRAGVSGYTIIREVTGKGDRGDRSGDDLAGALRNGYILCACTDTQAQWIGEALRPVLRRFGGVCLVTDCLWLDH